MRKQVWMVLALISTIAYSQEVVTIAGLLEISGATNGPASQATFDNPHGIAVDALGNVYVADRFGHQIRKYTQDGFVTTLAGSGQVGSADGPGTTASFNEPWGLCVGLDGNLYVADTRNNLIRQITPTGQVSTFAGSGAFGATNGQGVNASFGNPTGIEMDEDGNLYVADHLTHVIRKITPSANVSTIAGSPSISGAADGFGSDARFFRPYGLSLDNAGNILVADEWNHQIRKISSDGEVTTLAGDGTIGYLDGLADAAKFNYPWDVTVDDLGNVFIADGYNQVIRKLIPTGSTPESYDVTTYAGNPGVSGGIDGYGNNAAFNAATNIHFWPQTKEIFVADAYNNLIRKIVDVDRPNLSLQLLNLSGTNPEDAFLCQGMLLEFEATPDTLDNYSFYANGQLLQNGASAYFASTDLPAGLVALAVVADDALGSIESNTITVFLEENLIDDFTADEINLTENNNSVEFEAFILDNSTIDYYWEFGDLTSGSDNFSNLSNPTHTYSAPGNYTVTLSVENEMGCRDTLQKGNYIHYLDENRSSDVFIPNAFTPNGDGENDILFVRGSEIERLQFFIYNQWGELIFQTTNPNDGWDGSFRGKPASGCSYVYLVKAQLNNGSEFTASGHVSIIR